MARDRARTAPPAPAPRNGPQGEEGNRPAYEVRLGRIKATVWRNVSDSGPWYSTVISRLYKEGNDWRQSDSYGRDDLPLVKKVADMVHTWIYQHGHAALEQ
ncbi:MAG: hypothetical protein U0746_10530 [Gemmataceae bacterium]